jgi:CDP-glucose 4,6-dehydratase
MLAQQLALDPGRFARGWNFGPVADDMASVATVVGEFLRQWGQSGDFSHQLGNHPHEAAILTLDSALAARELGWAPRLSLCTAIEWTAAWYRAQLDGEHAARLCRSQIDRYLAGDAAQEAA